MQESFYESGNCVQIICAILGVHPKTWVQFGSNKPRTSAKTGVQEVRRAKTNQRDSKSEFNYEPEGREFESPRARHLGSYFSAKIAGCGDSTRFGSYFALAATKRRHTSGP